MKSKSLMSSMGFICINLIHRELMAIALGILLLDCVEFGDSCKNQNGNSNNKT
jgi:hypothetical protein